MINAKGITGKRTTLLTSPRQSKHIQAHRAQGLQKIYKNSHLKEIKKQNLKDCLCQNFFLIRFAYDTMPCFTCSSGGSATLTTFYIVIVKLSRNFALNYYTKADIACRAVKEIDRERVRRYLMDYLLVSASSHQRQEEIPLIDQVDPVSESKNQKRV